jgi:regulator of sirC expression with transglutaminase-like and TPR domain
MSFQTRKDCRDRFREIVSRDEDEINLAEAALLIAAEEYPGLDVELYLDKLDRFAEIARDLAANATDASGMITAINSTLYDRLGFHANRQNYYDPRNSFLNEVLDRRVGIPITLSVVYMEIARRIGFIIKGVGLPGHFIVKHPLERGDMFIDPFNGGRLLGEFGCAELINELSGGKLSLRPEHLAAVTKKQILQRMLSNLLGIYAASDHCRALAAIEKILIITPGSPAHIRDRGLLLGVIGRASEAISELERYLSLSPAAPDAGSIREQIKHIKAARAKWN